MHSETPIRGFLLARGRDCLGPHPLRDPAPRGLRLTARAGDKGVVARAGPGCRARGARRLGMRENRRRGLGLPRLYFLRAGAASVSAGAGCKRQACATVVFIPGASPSPPAPPASQRRAAGLSDCLPRSRGSPLAGEPSYPAPLRRPASLRRPAPLPVQGLRSERGRGLKGVRRGWQGGGGDGDLTPGLARLPSGVYFIPPCCLAALGLSDLGQNI